MRIHCSGCGQPLDAGDEHCVACGQSAAAEAERDAAPRNGVYLMLLMANVLRLRRQYQLAEAQCSEVLRREPRNAAAHSILGDIARDQGNLKDAMEWYKMALDLDPGNASDRRKLEEIIDQLYSRQQRKPLGLIRDDVKGQIGSAAADMPSAVSITLGAVLVVILLVTVLALAMGRGGAPPPPATTAQPTSGGFVANVPTTSNGAPAPTGGRTQTADPQVLRFREDVGPLEAALTQALVGEARAADPNCEVRQAEIDPRDGKVSVRISMPGVWSVQQTRDSITRLAEQLAVAAVEWDARVSAVQVRCDVRRRDRPEKLAFIGEVAAVSLAATSQDPPADSSETLFQSAWWDPELESPVDRSPVPGTR